MKTEITMLGTGYSNATKCYNTCFTISENVENDAVRTDDCAYTNIAASASAEVTASVEAAANAEATANAEAANDDTGTNAEATANAEAANDEAANDEAGANVEKNKPRRNHFLVDTGGGNYILRALELAEIELEDVHDIFITHAHNDHILGILWIISEITRHMRMQIYEGDLRIYCHDESAHVITELARLTLFGRTFEEIGRRIKLIVVEDGESYKILNFNVKFCDIHSTKQKQFGFSLTDERKKRIVCCGDEPLSAEMESVAAGCDMLMHEAYCLYSERDRYKPYKKHHSTAKDACENAMRLGARNIILYHTEDNNLKSRKSDYIAEGRLVFDGGIYVPDDGEIIHI